LQPSWRCRSAPAPQQIQYGELNPAATGRKQRQDRGDRVLLVRLSRTATASSRTRAWLKKLPPDVEFRRVPAVFNSRWGHDAAIFYTSSAMGVLEKLHRPLFDAIHKRACAPTTRPRSASGCRRTASIRRRFMDTMKSFGVQSKTRRASQQTVAYKIDGTPAMAVRAATP
jgi:hypothetical protein